MRRVRGQHLEILMAFECIEGGDERAELAHERRIKRCVFPRCNARIIWFRTSGGRNIAVDADTVEATDKDYDYVRHTCHFEVCNGRSKETTT